MFSTQQINQCLDLSPNRREGVDLSISYISDMLRIDRSRGIELTKSVRYRARDGWSRGVKI